MTTTNAIWRKLDRIHDLPTLPAVAVKINQLLNDEESLVEAISVLIEKDLALSARILKLVNSSFFGLQSQVASIHRAMVLLGFNQIRNAVYAVTVLDAVGCDGGVAKHMWRHGAAVAATTQYMALKMNAARQSRENAFTAGLLHDIGKFVLWRHFPEISAGGSEDIPADGPAGPPAEMQEAMADHAEVGQYLARRWQLPDSLQDVIRFHHQPSEARIDPALAALVHVADQVAHRIEAGAAADPPPVLDPAIPAALREWRDAPQDRLAEVAAQIEAAGQFFDKE